MKKTKIFISYRRESAIDIAARISDYFESRGFDVFYDINSMKIGRFDAQIEENLKTCDFFIIILSEGSLDRCINRDDWVRREFELAAKNKVQIVPMILPNFTFPDNLPTSMKSLIHYHGVEYNAVLFELVMQKLEQILRGQSGNNDTVIYLKELLKQIYAESTKYRNGFRSGDEAKIHESSANMTALLQRLYYYSEEHAFDMRTLSSIALGVVDQYNCYVTVYNEFVNCPDRMSEKAQEYASLAEDAFKEFVDLILKTINEL